MSDPVVDSMGRESPSAAQGGDPLAWDTGEPESDNSGQADGKGRDGNAAPEAGKQSWKNLLDLDAQLFEQRNIRLLTPEARLLINLKLSESMTVTEAMEMAGVSYRGFYAVLERLKRAGLVGQMKDRTDQRVRNLRLEPSTPIRPASL